jgi:hypothetical protein
MASFGRIQEFNKETERFSTYIDRLELYFEANSIPEEKQVAVFLTVVGAKNFSLLNDLCAPEKPKDKTLVDLIGKLMGHFEPKPIVISERFHFHKRDQKPGESISEFVADLRRLSVNCQFGERLEEMIRDRFVCGLVNETTQQRLLLEKDLTLESAIQLASMRATALKDASQIQASTSPKDHSVHRVLEKKAAYSHASPISCHRCGGPHLANNCRFIDAKCRHCAKTGHIAKVCRSKSRPTDTAKPSQRTWKSKRPSDKANTVEINCPPAPSPMPLNISDTEIDSSMTDPYKMFSVTSIARSKPIMITVKVNNRDLKMELDTGASVSIISKSMFKSVFENSVSIQVTDISLRTYLGEELPVLGVAEVEVAYKSQVVPLPLVVVKGHGSTLFGRNWLERIQVNWASINNVQYSSSVTEVIRKHSELFSQKLGTLKGMEAKIFVSSTAQPRFFKPRPLPYALKGRVEE